MKLEESWEKRANKETWESKIKQIIRLQKNKIISRRNYASEIEAFSHRLGVAHVEKERIVTALTMPSYNETQHNNTEELIHNSQLIKKGLQVPKKN